MTKERKKQIVAATLKKNEQTKNKDLSEAEVILSDLATDWWRDKINAADIGASVPMGDRIIEYWEKKTEEGDGLDKYMKKAFKKELLTLINTYCMEADSDTPDYILAEYMVQCLKLFNKSTQARDMHMGIK